MAESRSARTRQDVLTVLESMGMGPAMIEEVSTRALRDQHESLIPVSYEASVLRALAELGAARLRRGRTQAS